MALDITKLKRSDTFIKRNCKKIGDKLVAAKDISVIAAITLESGKLLSMDDRIYSVGTLMYTDGKEFAVMNLAVIVELGLTDHRKVMVGSYGGEEVECYEFQYSKGSTIHPTDEVPVQASIAYDYINHHLLMGKSIPYFDKDDMDSILDSMPRFCNFGLPEYGYTNHFTEMVIRDPDDLQVPARLSKKSGYVNIPFSSVILNVSSIVGKNRGGYLEDGIQSATLTTSESSTSFEKVLRA